MVNYIFPWILLMALLTTSGCGSDQKGVPAQNAGQAGAAQERMPMEQRIVACSHCHSEDRTEVSGAFPNLNGQSEEYLMKQLKNFKSGERQGNIMGSTAKDLTEAEMQTLASHFAKQASRSLEPSTDKEMIALGKTVYTKTSGGNGVSTCASCHGDRGEGKTMADGSVAPFVSGQKLQYLKMQMFHFKYLYRTNDANSVMRTAASNLSDREVVAVAEYLTTLKR